jgi:hypothetical protein
MNLWSQFTKMVNRSSPLLIGEVDSVSGDTCIVTLLPSGVTIQAEGIGRSLSIGQRWIIQDGKIIGEAPSGAVTYVDI